MFVREAHPVVHTRLGVELDLGKVTSDLRSCGQWFHFRHYHTIDQVRLHEAIFCKQHLICPLCAVRRGSRMMETYIPKFETALSENPLLKPAVMTLTVRNGWDLDERIDHLKSSLRTLLERRRHGRKGGRYRTELKKVAGAIGSFEVTQKGRGWHPHIHLVVLLEEWIDQAALSREWHEITGDSFVVGISSFDKTKPPAYAFAEVCKYALKFSDMSLEDTWKCFLALKGMRLAFSLGCFRGLVVPEDLRDEPLEGLPYIEFLYRYIHGKGYELHREERPHSPS